VRPVLANYKVPRRIAFAILVMVPQLLALRLRIGLALPAIIDMRDETKDWLFHIRLLLQRELIVSQASVGWVRDSTCWKSLSTFGINT
jgi:hypothetical protein